MDGTYKKPYYLLPDGERVLYVNDRNLAEFGFEYQNGQYIKGGYLDENGQYIERTSSFVYPDNWYELPRKDKFRLRREASIRDEEAYNELTKDAYCLNFNKKLSVLISEYAPEELLINRGFNDRYCPYSIVNEIITGKWNLEADMNYHIITFTKRIPVPEEVFNDILSNEPEYLLVVGYELFNILPRITREGPDIVTPVGTAETYYVSTPSGREIICLPMPHPRTPGFNDEVISIWHDVIVELFNH